MHLSNSLKIKLVLAISFLLFASIVDAKKSKKQVQSTTGVSAAETLRARLATASTEIERNNLLDDAKYVFDYTSFLGIKNSTGVPGLTIGKGGRVVAANTINYPALIGHGISMTIGFIEPCGINNPHTHPRATEMLLMIEGEMRVGFFMENGARFIGNTLKLGQATVFPQGSIHFEINTGCTPATFIAAFNHQDPGVQTSATSYFGIPADIAAIGLETPLPVNISFVNNLVSQLSRNPGLGLHECYQRCGLLNKTSRATPAKMPDMNIVEGDVVWDSSEPSSAVVSKVDVMFSTVIVCVVMLMGGFLNK